MLFDFSELHGYEVLRTLVEAGERIRDTYSMISSAMRELSEDNPPVTFHAESIECEFAGCRRRRCCGLLSPHTPTNRRVVNSDPVPTPVVNTRCPFATQPDCTPAPPDADWSFADVVFVNASCFDDDLVRAINMKVAKLRVGAFVITVTKPSVTPALKMVSSGTYRMGDSTVTVYIQQRVRRTPTAAEPAPMSPNSVATAQQAAKTMADLSSPQGESLLAAKSRRARAQRAAGAAPAVPAPEETGFRPDRSFGASGRPRPGASALSREAARGSPPSGGSRGSRGRSIGAGSGAGADVSPSRRVEAEKVLSGSGSDDGDIPVAQLRLKASVAVEARGEVPSSPQGDLLLARKMQQQQQKRSPGMRDRPGSARARLSADDSQDAGGIPVRRRMPPSMSSSLRYEMAGETPSSPQGDVLLARKAQFQHSHPPQPRFYS